MRPKVAVIHHAGSFFPLDLFHEVGDSAELLWVVDDAVAEDPVTVRLLRRLGTVVDIAGLDLDRAANRLADHHAEGIVSFVDDQVVVASKLAARLELPYHTPEVAHTLVDKRRQRAALQQAGIPGPAYWLVPAGLTQNQIADLAGRVTYPAVLKPAEGSGSRGIRFIADSGDLLSELAGRSGGTDCLLEEYLYDDVAEDQWYASYLSVESVVSGGRVSHVAITGRFPLAEHFRETGNFIPGILQPHLHRPVLGMVSDAIDALGVTSAVIHTEIKLTPEGPRLIEVNGRLGGRPPFVLNSVSEVNLFQAACGVAAGVPVAFEELAACREVGFWLMLQPPVSARHVAAVDGLNDLSDLEGVDIVSLDRRPGQAVDWRNGTDSQVVTVRGRVSDQGALEVMVDSIRRKVSISYGG